MDARRRHDITVGRECRDEELCYYDGEGVQGGRDMILGWGGSEGWRHVITVGR